MEINIICSVLLIFVVTIGTILWNRSIRKRVKKNREEMNSLLNRYDKNVIASRTDLDGKITHVSDAFCNISGYSRDYLMGKPHSLVRHQDTDSRVFQELWSTIQRGDIWRGEVQNRRRDGSSYWVYSVVSPEFHNGEIVGYSSIRQDITDRKKLEELSQEMKSQQIYLKTILNSIEQFIITTDGISLRSANKKFLDFFGVKSVEEFKSLGYSCICDSFIKRDGYLSKNIDGMSWVDYIVLNRDKKHSAIIERDNKEHIFSVSASALYINDEFIDVAVFTDITESENHRKQIETILSSIISPVLITSKESREILYVNREAEIQYSSSELIGKSIDRIYTEPEDQRKNISKAIETNDGVLRNFETKYQKFSGEEFDALLSLIEIEYQEQRSYLGMVTDITQQKRRENQIVEQKRIITDSIKYASYIQNAILPDGTVIEKFTEDSFYLWEPRDSVGGDIFFVDEVSESELLIIVADCTSHGVPGAFITMLVKAIQKQLLTEIEFNRIDVSSPASILQYFNKEIKHLLNQKDRAKSASNVGFDGGVLYYNRDEECIRYSGAETPLYYLADGKIEQTKYDRHSIGYATSDCDYKFKDYYFSTNRVQQFYITTDGYYDQVGGEKRFMFGKKRVAKALQEIYSESMERQKDLLYKRLKDYEGDERRRDDITFIGFRV